MQTNDSPNILVFFCDQLRLDLLGCYGGTLVRTPNIDALAGESVVFDRAITPCALCSPARASLMTGVYPHSHHMFNNSTPRYSYCEHLRPDIQMLQDWADKHTDYETGYFGKWHIGPAQDLFDSAFHQTHPKPDECDLPYLDSSHWHPSKWGGMVDSYANGKCGTINMPIDEFPDGAAARFTRQFMSNRKAGGQPFLAFCAFPGPHSPWLVPHEFGIRYDPATIPIWPNRNDSFAGKPINQRRLRMLDMHRTGPLAAVFGRWECDDVLREALACCFSYLELIDQLVGDVVADLKASGQFENTMIVFTADHGDMAGSHGFLSKGGYMYDEIYRIPLIMKPAGATAPQRRVSAPVNLVDVTATIMHAMAGNPVGEMDSHALHGTSLLPFASAYEDWERPVNYGEYHGDWYGHYSSRMVSDGRWKLVWNLSDLCELYDLENDPHELTNLFYEPAHRATRARYFDLLVAEAKRLKDAHINLLDPQAVELDAPSFAEGVAVST